MIDLPKPEVILTHESDLDGLVSGVLLKRLARRVFDAEVPLQAYHYQNWRTRDLRESAAWVCDFTYEARLDKQNWAVIDHHPTDAKPQKARLIHDVNKSAGLLCYDLCREAGLASPALDRLVHLNNVADIFLEDDPDFVLANDYANLVKSYGFWNLHEIVDGQIERLVDHPLLQVMEVKRRVEDPLGLAWSKDNVQRLSSTVGLVDTIVGNTNLIVHHLLEQKATPYPVLLTLFRKANNQVIASLRSRNGEAAKVAERLQGGGHPNASGAMLPRSVRSIADAIEYLKQVLNPNTSQPMRLNSLENLFNSIDVQNR